jgi:hypothetical protein
MKTKTLICITLIKVILGSVSFALPPSVERLNEFIDSNDKRSGTFGTYIDSDFNIHAFYLDYPAGQVNELYYLRVDSTGNEFYRPKLVCSDSALLHDLLVLQDNRGYFHITAADYYFQTDSDGNFIEKLAPVPYGTLNAQAIYNDSIFMTFRRDNLRGCGASFEEDYELFWLFLLNKSGRKLEIRNFPIEEPDYFSPILEKLADNKYLVVLSLVPGPFNEFTQFRFHSFVADLDSSYITSHFSGNMINNGNLLYADFKKEILINGPSTLRKGDTLYYFMRVPPKSNNFNRIVKDPLMVMAFDKMGNKINIEGLENAKIIYENIDQFDGTEQLINCRTGSREGYKINWQYKFGLISFKDFPLIYIDMGED